MARPTSITYEQVAAIAHNLVAAGNKSPSAGAVREELAKRSAPGTPIGSPNTLQKHLDEWRRRERPADPIEAPQLPAQLAGDLARALSAVATHAREQVEERLAQVQVELDELAVIGERNELLVEQLNLDLAQRTSERDAMAGQLEDRTNKLVELEAGLEAAQETIARLEREMLEAKATAQAATGRVEEIRTHTARQIEQMQVDLAKAQAAAADSAGRAAETQQKAVEALARLDGERAARLSLEGQLKSAAERAHALEGDSARAAAAEASATGLKEQVVLLTNTVEMLKSLLPEKKSNPENLVQ